MIYDFTMALDLQMRMGLLLGQWLGMELDIQIPCAER